MPIPSIYINLEDDVSKVVQRIQKEKAASLVLVCPKRCLLFSDSINLRLLKKQTELLGKEVFILTMDERGQLYAKEAGFPLKFLPKSNVQGGLSDIRRAPLKSEIAQKIIAKKVSSKVPVAQAISNTVNQTVSGLKNLVRITPEVTIKKSSGDLLVSESEYPIQIETSVKNEKKSRFYKRLTLSLVVVALLLIVVVTFVVLPKATVAVYPKTEPITRDWDVTVSTGVQAPDATNMVLPATPVSQTFNEQQQFQSQGKKDVGNPASGTVQIYNFTRSPLNLKASTTLLSIGSKNYLLTQDLSGIRPTTYKNAVIKEVDDSSLTDPVQVVAAQGGESYNVPGGARMEITNQVFGSKPQFLFAKTVSPVTGGTSRFLSVVTDQDITAAQTALESQAVSDERAQLKNQNLILPDKAFVLDNQGFTADQTVNAESPTINAGLKVKVTGLAFNMKDLQKLIADRIGQTLDPNKSLKIDNSDIINYTLKSIDLNAGTATISVHFEGKDVMDVDLSDVTSELVGKSESQVNEILLSRPEIDKVDVTLAPTWQKTFPLFASKIHVQVAQ